MARYEHVIWDWNGTLLDDVAVCVEIVNVLLRRRNKPAITVPRYRSVFDFPVRTYYAKVGFEDSDAAFEVLADEYVALYDQRQFDCGLHPEATGVLRALRDRGIAQSILSAYQQPRLDGIVDHFALRPFFSHVVGTADIYADGKIGQGRRLIERLDVDGSAVLFVGDTVHDFEVAQAMGTDCALVAGGHHPKEKLAACGVPVLDGVGEVLRFFDGFGR